MRYIHGHYYKIKNHIRQFPKDTTVRCDYIVLGEAGSGDKALLISIDDISKGDYVHIDDVEEVSVNEDFAGLLLKGEIV